MAREHRLLGVKDLRLKFAFRRLEKDMISLEEIMMAFDITISIEERAGGQTKHQEEQEAMDWMVVEEAEHAFLDQLQMELGIEVSNVVRWMRPVQEDPAGKLEYGSQDEEMEFDGDVRWGQR